MYEVWFPNRRTEELAANVIAEAVYAQCDADGNQYVLLDAIVDYLKDPSVAVTRDDQVTIVDGKKIVKRSTRGWELCCEWKDGSTSWQKLSDLKESHPLQAEDDKCLVTMEKYTREILDGFPEEISTTNSTPAADHLFKVREEHKAKHLPEEQATGFHRMVAQWLFLSGRVGCDIQTAVAFLTTKDWGLPYPWIIWGSCDGTWMHHLWPTMTARVTWGP